MPTAKIARNRNKFTTVRIFTSTANKMTDIIRVCGVTNLPRMTEALCHGYQMLDTEHQLQAIEQATKSSDHTMGRQITYKTHKTLCKIKHTKGIPYIVILDAFTHAWHMLTHDQKRNAIELSGTPTTPPESTPQVTPETASTEKHAATCAA